MTNLILTTFDRISLISQGLQDDRTLFSVESRSIEPYRTIRNTDRVTRQHVGKASTKWNRPPILLTRVQNASPHDRKLP
jgi:hypothetical protein